MKPHPLFILLAAIPAHAITIQIDYSLDTNGFFDEINHPERRTAIEAVAAFYGELLHDKLLEIDPSKFGSASWTVNFTHPSTGDTTYVSNPVIPEDTIVIYVGARDLGGSTVGRAGFGGWSAGGFPDWFTRIRGRGNPGAEPSTSSLRTDHAPWGGTASFDIDTSWNFSLTTNDPGQEFVTVALHEIGHVLGLGTANSWDNLISSSLFFGTAAIRSWGVAPPVEPDAAHFSDDFTFTSPSYGSFGSAHGASRDALMLPSTTDNGSTFLTITDVDLAALADIGWEVQPPPAIEAPAISPAGVSLGWPSSSLADYRIERADAGLDFEPVHATAGSGSTQSWTDTEPPIGQAFYRLSITPLPSSASSATSPSQALSVAPTDPAPGVLYRTSEPGREVTGCSGH